MRTDTRDLVATVAYMIGIKKHIVEQCFDGECHELLTKLYEDKNITALRYLCKLRTMLMFKFKKTDDEMRFNLKNLHKLDWYDAENIKQLEKWGIPIIKTNYRSELYMEDFNRLIAENIDKCKIAFPDWVNWNYIRDLFVIPSYKKPGVLKKEFDKFMSNNGLYPFQMYIHWEPEECGSLLYTDGKFLSIIYKQHGDVFTDFTKYKDAHNETKNNIYSFLECSYRVAIAVDCENSDVYKLYSVLKNLDQNELTKIEKIVLYDDYHTNCGWDWLGKFTHIPVEHVMVERVTDQNSVVDINMTAGVCRDYYENNITY